MTAPDAITLVGVTKHFKKTSKRREYTTLKTELIRVLKGDRKLLESSTHIEALKGVDLRIPKGSTVGIVGRNGSGKSTLLKIITGIYSASSGEVKVNGRISALLELGAGFHPDFTGRENILINGIILGMSGAEVKQRLGAIIDFAELGDFIDEPVRTYSSGMFMRLAFAVATHVDPEILIIDEILSVGDEHFQRKSQAKMEEFKKAGKTIVLVTHSLNSVESWCDLAAWIDGGHTRMCGDPRQVVAEYRRAITAAETEAERTGTSALSRPGAALPGLVPADTTGLPAVEIAGLRPLNGQSAPCTTFGPGAQVQVAVELMPRRNCPCVLSLEVSTVGGQAVVRAAHESPGVGTAPLGLKATLPPIAWEPGEYVVRAAIGPPAGEPWSRGEVTFSVQAPVGVAEGGTLPTTWSLLLPGAP